MSDRPTVFGGLLAVVAATVGAASVAETTALRLAAAGAGVGFVVFVLGVVVARSRSRFFGLLVALGGIAGAGGGVAYGATVASEQLHLAVVAPALAGAFFVSLGVAPLRGSGSRRFVKIACWLVFLSPVLSAGMEYGNVEQVLVGTVAAALVWDLGENSVSLGRQIGREARTFWNETVHGTGTVLVGAVSSGAVYVAYGYSVGSGSLEAVFFLLVSVVLLVAFLHR